jgi:predicted DNA-binding transcriptional regulator AlpA
MPDRDTDMIGQLAALVVAVLARDHAAAEARAGEIGSRLGTREDAEPGAVHAALRAALRFDPVALAEIAEMTGESTANLNYLLSAPGSPRPVRLARMKVWRRSEVVVWWGSIGREVTWTDTPGQADR